MPLPFELQPISRGYAALDARARRIGPAAAAAAARALGELLETAVELEGRALPGPTWERSSAVRLAIDLTAVAAVAALEVESALVVRVVDLLAGGDGTGAAPAASWLTPLEQATLELLALLALDGACAVKEVEDALAPRLMREAPPADPGALAVELELRAGGARGRARLLLPPAALRALAGAPELAECRLRLPVSLRDGAVELLPAELESLEPGDVLLLERREHRGALALPGGWRAKGRLEPDGFHVEETTVTTRTSQIPITLEVELCRLEVTLAELARLEPGGVLPLAVDRRGQVTLRAGDRAVARGELVEVEGAVGVRITALEVEP
jgi:type III secretion protein Q